MKTVKIIGIIPSRYKSSRFEGKPLADILGKPMSYKTTDEFLRMFGYGSLEELPELPKYRIDENQQIVSVEK